LVIFTTAFLADRHPILAGDDQRSQQVDSTFEVILLGVEVDANEVGVQIRR